MSAGTGIVHSEINAADRPCHLLQIWIQPESRGLPPSYEQKAFARAEGWTPLIDPDGSHGTMAIHRQVRLWRGRGSVAPSGAPAAALPLVHAAEAHGWIQVISGNLRLELNLEERSIEAALQAGDGLGFGPGTAGLLHPLDADADVLLFELR